jgi:hypothetical protein
MALTKEFKLRPQSEQPLSREAAALLTNRELEPIINFLNEAKATKSQKIINKSFPLDGKKSRKYLEAYLGPRIKVFSRSSGKDISYRFTPEEGAESTKKANPIEVTIVVTESFAD